MFLHEKSTKSLSRYKVVRNISDLDSRFFFDFDIFPSPFPVCITLHNIMQHLACLCGGVETIKSGF